MSDRLRKVLLLSTNFRLRGGIAIAAVAALALLLGLRVTPDRQGLIVPPGRRAPELCLSKAMTGQPCPGCGFGRSVVEAVKGKLDSSRAMHPAGIFLAAWLWLVASLSVVLVFTRREKRGALVEASVYLAGLVIACLLAARASVERRDAPAFTGREAPVARAQDTSAIDPRAQLTQARVAPGR